MASILSRTVGAEVDKRLVLANEQCGRTMFIGSDWTTIRIGVRWFINKSATYVAFPVIFFGLSSGDTNMYGDATTTNFFGIRSVSGTGTADTSGADTWLSTPNLKLIKKVDTTVTEYAGPDDETIIGFNAVRRFALFLQITKGSPNYTTYVWGSYYGHSQTDIDYDAFYAIVESKDTPPITLKQIGASASYDYAMDEVAGALDTINVGWFGIADSLEISDIAYTKVE